MQCNIDKTDRINRSILGVILIAAALLELGKNFYLILGIVLVAQSAIGICSIPIILEKIGINKKKT